MTDMTEPQFASVFDTTVDMTGSDGYDAPPAVWEHYPVSPDSPLTWPTC
jgi:hypothetical protein